MPLPFACPHCGEQTLVDDQFAGLSGQCIHCAKPILVPAFAKANSRAVAVSSAKRPRGESSFWGVALFTGLLGVAALATLGVLLYLLGPPLLTAYRAAADRRQCANNLRQIHTALKAYEKNFGRLPPAYVTDKAGTRLYSWRVLILPYLGPEGEAIAKQFDRSQAWNSPQNGGIQWSMPKVYNCPPDSAGLARKETSYQLIVGPRTAFPLEKSRRGDEPGMAEAIWVVEAQGTKVPWAAPGDLPDDSSFTVGVDLGGNHAGGVNVLYGDGRVEFRPDGTTPAQFHDQATVRP